MAVIAAYAYSNGRRTRELSLDDPGAMLTTEGEFVWIGVVDPEETELRKLQICFDLHPLAVEDALKDHVRPKIEVYNEEIFIVARTVSLQDDVIHYGKTAVFVGTSHIITVRTGSQRDHRVLRTHLEASPLLLRYGVDYVLYGVLDFIVDSYLPVVETIEEDLLEIERRALDTFLSRYDVNRIIAIRRELIHFRRIMGPMEEVLGRLGHLEVKCLDAEVRPYFRDVHDQVRRVASRIEGSREIISSVMEASSLLEQHRQGTITRQLAAWAAILAVPTAVAGIYGMNFDVMPELRWRYGYFGVLAGIFSIAGYLFWRFRRSGWL